MMKKFKTIFDRIKIDLHDYKIAVISIAIYYIVVRLIFHAFCPFIITIGIPCPGCGMTRAFYYFLTLRFKRAFDLNPAVVFWLLFAVYFVWTRYISGKYNQRRINVILSVVCIITVAIYVYRMVNYFPSYPPLVYNKDNILMKICQILK